MRLIALDGRSFGSCSTSSPGSYLHPANRVAFLGDSALGPPDELIAQADEAAHVFLAAYLRDGRNEDTAAARPRNVVAHTFTNGGSTASS